MSVAAEELPQGLKAAAQVWEQKVEGLLQWMAGVENRRLRAACCVMTWFDEVVEVWCFSVDMEEPCQEEARRDQHQTEGPRQEQTAEEPTQDLPGQVDLQNPDPPDRCAAV